MKPYTINKCAATLKSEDLPYLLRKRVGERVLLTIPLFMIPITKLKFLIKETDHQPWSGERRCSVPHGGGQGS